MEVVSELREFLRGYAELAGDTGLLREYAPFHSGVNMAGGWSGVYDKNGKPFVTCHDGHTPSGDKFPYHPSMPCAPHAMAASGFIADCLNFFANQPSKESE